MAIANYDQFVAKADSQINYEETLQEYVAVVEANDADNQYNYTYFNFLE